MTEPGNLQPQPPGSYGAQPPGGATGPRANFGQRLLAALIDGVVVGIPFAILFFALKGVGYFLGILLSVAYGIYLEAGPSGLREEGPSPARAGRDGSRNSVHVIRSRHRPHRAGARYRRGSRGLHLVIT